MVLCGWKLVTCSWHLDILHDYCLTKGYPTSGMVSTQNEQYLWLARPEVWTFKWRVDHPKLYKSFVQTVFFTVPKWHIFCIRDVFRQGWVGVWRCCRSCAHVGRLRQEWPALTTCFSAAIHAIASLQICGFFVCRADGNQSPLGNHQ